MKKRTALSLLSAGLLLHLSACAPDDPADGTNGAADRGVTEADSPLDAEAIDADTAQEIAVGLVEKNEKLLDGIGGLAAVRTEVDAGGVSHTHFQQSHGEVPVFSGELIVHLYPNGTLYTMTDDLVRDVDAATAPQILDADAIDEAMDLYGFKGQPDEDPESALWVLPTADGGTHLAWRVEIRDMDREDPAMPVMFLDAEKGDLLLEYDNLQSYSLSDSDKVTYDLAGKTRFNRASVGDSSDGELLTTHESVGQSLDFLATNYGRDSYDDAGKVVSSYGHYGRNVVNAYWDGRRLIFGDGDGVNSNYLGVLDIAAHELAHALTEEEANLIYSYESGALNEAASDIFAAAVEAYVDGAVTTSAWELGEDCWLAGSALRYMHRPSDDGSSRDHYSDRYTGSSDNGGVHWNSGIANHWFYLLSEGGQHHDPAFRSGYSVNGVGIDTAYDIWYAALTGYMTSSTDFAGARTATENACAGLGLASAVCDEVSVAWYEVGVGSDPGGTTPPDTGDTADTADTGTPPDDTGTPPDDTGDPGAGCPSGYTEIAGDLTGTGDDDQYTYTSSGSGTHDFTLTGPGSADFDLYLYQLKGRNYKEKASSTTSTSTESISYSGSSGDYLVQVTSYAGGGAYTLCYSVPN